MVCPDAVFIHMDRRGMGSGPVSQGYAWLPFLLTTFFPATGPAAPELTDAAIENAVEQQLLADQVIPAYRITVESTRGVVP
ncbi:MAG: BON domain-containing protein [Desulfotignum sp.]|nr:BON domain-containing protein [Desulfotignum sp.]